jgi:hypothetical protein
LNKATSQKDNSYANIHDVPILALFFSNIKII